MVERNEILTAMSELKLYGLKAAFDEIITTAIKRQHEPQYVVGDLLTAEITEKQARSIRYQITIAKLPLAKDVEDFRFDTTPINESLVRDPASGNFLAHQRNVVLFGGTGTGKTHLAAIWRLPQLSPLPTASGLSEADSRRNVTAQVAGAVSREP
jgi:DNA replication protein DnaC